MTLHSSLRAKGTKSHRRVSQEDGFVARLGPLFLMSFPVQRWRDSSMTGGFQVSESGLVPKADEFGKQVSVVDSLRRKAF